MYPEVDTSSSVSDVVSASVLPGAYLTARVGQIGLEEAVDYRYHDEDKAIYLKHVAQGARDMGEIRTFETGATRDTDSGKHDYRGYLSPLVLRRFGEYMTKHRIQKDGAIRASDNWKKGIPQQEYLSSALRHVIDVWLLHEGYDGVATPDIEEALCGLLFNVQGYLHSYLEETVWPTFIPTGPSDSERDEVPF